MQAERPGARLGICLPTGRERFACVPRVRWRFPLTLGVRAVLSPQGHLKKFREEIQDMGTKILQAALALHDKVSSTFRKTAINFHYEFTVRHLANVFQVRAFFVRNRLQVEPPPPYYSEPQPLAALAHHSGRRQRPVATYASMLIHWDPLLQPQGLPAAAGAFLFACRTQRLRAALTTRLTRFPCCFQLPQGLLMSTPGGSNP